MSDTSRTPVWWTLSSRDIAALLAVVGVLVGLSWWVTQPTSTAVSPVASPDPLAVHIAATASALPSPSPTPTVIAIHVVGAVNRPGVVELPLGSRANAAITAAGGFAETADQRTINLAQPLTDGQQLVVGALGEQLPIPVSASQAPGTTQSSSGEGVVHLNTATVSDLESLPGIGPKTAQTIIEYRDEHGPFTSVDHLEAVPGIGPKTIDKFRERVRP